MTRDPADSPEPQEGSSKKAPFWLKTAIVCVEIAFVLGLVAVWLLSEEVRKSKSLWILFLYSFPSEFLIAPVPHEPIFFYFGKYYTPLVVAAVSVASTVLTEALNYSVFGYFADLKVFERVRESGLTRKIVDFFNRAPFTALLIVGISPLPFYPMRFLVVLAKYPPALYLLAVFVARAPRFYLLAWLGSAFMLPDWALVVLFASLILVLNVPLVLSLARKKKK